MKIHKDSIHTSLMIDDGKDQRHYQDNHLDDDFLDDYCLDDDQ